MQEQNAAKGILALIIATVFFATQDIMTKHLTSSLHAVQIVSIRFFFFAIFSLVFAYQRRVLSQSFRSNNYLLQCCRGLLIVTEITVFAYAIGHLGLAEIHTLFACFPLIVTALSQPLLGEKVGWRRWLAVAVGFLGTLLILKPGFGLVDPFALLALSAAGMFALYNIMTRKVSKTDSFETSLVYFGVVGFLGSLLVVPFYWQTPAGDEYLWLALISITGIIGHLLLIKALELTPAVVLQPFNYFVLVWAIIMGYLLHGEILDSLSFIGVTIVVCSGIFIARREYSIYRKKLSPQL